MTLLINFIKSNIGLIALVAVVLIAIGVLIGKLIKSMRRLKEAVAEPLQVLRTFKENAPKIQEMKNSTPKSVSGMDSVYLPLIAEDFPELNIEQFKKMSKDSLVEVFNSIESQSIDKESNLSTNLLKKTEEIIKDHKSQGIKEHFDNVMFHNIVISRYVKEKGKVLIIFQTALQYINYITDANGEVIIGDKEFHTQEKYEISMQYIQDVNKVGEYTNGSSVGLNCPNCGAPITNLGAKQCDYCGTGVVEINLKSWEISDYRRR